MWLVLSVYLFVFFNVSKAPCTYCCDDGRIKQGYGNEHVQGCTELSEVASSSLFYQPSARDCQSQHIVSHESFSNYFCAKSAGLKHCKRLHFLFFFYLTKLTADFKFPDYIHKWKRSQNNISCRNLLLVMFQLKT